MLVDFYEDFGIYSELREGTTNEFKNGVNKLLWDTEAVLKDCLDKAESGLLTIGENSQEKSGGHTKESLEEFQKKLINAYKVFMCFKQKDEINNCKNPVKVSVYLSVINILKKIEAAVLKFSSTGLAILIATTFPQYLKDEYAKKLIIAAGNLSKCAKATLSFCTLLNKEIAFYVEQESLFEKSSDLPNPLQQDEDSLGDDPEEKEDLVTLVNNKEKDEETHANNIHVLFNNKKKQQKQ